MEKKETLIYNLLKVIDTVGYYWPASKARYRSIASMNMPTYYKSLARLYERKLINRKTKRGKRVYVVTSKGKGLLYKPMNSNNKRTDQLATILTFDIPEERKRERTIFRRYLVRNGYTLIQKSLLISPEKVTKELVELAKELKIFNNIKFISGQIDYLT